MSIEKPCQDVERHQENLEKSNIEQTRRKHLEIVAVGIGANPLTSKLSINALLRASDELAGIDYSKDRNETDPKTIEQIEAIGQWFLSGNDKEHLRFGVGVIVLSLLRNNPDSGYFKHLKDSLDFITDGKSVKIFDKVLGRK